MHYKQITNIKNKIIFSTTALLNDFQYRVLLKVMHRSTHNCCLVTSCCMMILASNGTLKAQPSVNARDIETTHTQNSLEN